MLQYQLEKRNHMITLYTKYHCETNWIERHWGYAKRITRLECDYTFASLKENIRIYIDMNQEKNSNVVSRRFYNRCFRYIEAYSKGKDVFEADDITKNFSKSYTSHRRIL